MVTPRASLGFAGILDSSARMELEEFANDLLTLIPEMDRDAASRPLPRRKRKKGKKPSPPRVPALATIGEDAFRTSAIRHLTARWPEKYSALCQEVYYVGRKGARCDLLLGPGGSAEWAIELEK